MGHIFSALKASLCHLGHCSSKPVVLRLLCLFIRNPCMSDQNMLRSSEMVNLVMCWPLDGKAPMQVHINGAAFNPYRRLATLAGILLTVSRFVISVFLRPEQRFDRAEMVDSTAATVSRAPWPA